MFEKMLKIFKNFGKKEQTENTSKDTAKERLHLVLMQDRANVSADFLELMKQEIIEVIKKYVEVDEKSIDVRLTNKTNDDGTNGAPALYANIPIINVKNDMKKEVMEDKSKTNKEKENETTEAKDDIEEKKPETEEIVEDNSENIETNENNTEKIIVQAAEVVENANMEEKNTNDNENTSLEEDANKNENNKKSENNK